MVAAALLASPFLLDYDLTLLAIPLAWSVREALRAGFAPGERARARARLRPAAVFALAGGRRSAFPWRR